MFILDKITAKEKSALRLRGWNIDEAKNIPADWDEDVAEDDDREWVVLYGDISLMSACDIFETNFGRVGM